MQSSIIFPKHMPLSMGSFIEMLNQDDRNPQEKITLYTIEQLVNNDHDNFIQLLQLESKSEKISLIQVAAQNGRYDIVKYLIDQAMKDDASKQILYHQLSRTDTFDRSIVHWLAQINTHEVSLCLSIILDTCNQLGMTQYVNQKENVFNATPLIMATKQGAIPNIKVLLEHGADIYAKTRDNETALDLIKYTDPKIAIPTMKYFIKNTIFGYDTFIKMHSDFKEIYNTNDKEDKTIDKILSALIAIDIDAALPHDLAQLSALKLLTNNALMASTLEEATLMLATHRQIDFAKALRGYNTHKKDEKNALINDIFNKTLETSAEWKLSENNSAIFAEANFLLLFQLPEAHKSALLLLMLLMVDAPSLALEGFKQINVSYLDIDNHFLLIRNILTTMINIKLTELTPIEHDNILLRYLIDKNTLFSHKQEKYDACDKLTILRDEIRNAKNIHDLQTSLMKISTDNLKLKIFEDSVWNEMMDIIKPNTTSCFP